jgi:glycine/D-amino acid oxidase-like deaminating enzyme
MRGAYFQAMIADPGVSLWNATLPQSERAPRASLSGDASLDVVVVGAGYTGLWTAYSLKRADPTLRIAICEREVAGFGASGRNGGWCSSFFAGSPDAAMQQAMFDTLDEIERVVTKEDIDCNWARGGAIDVATRAPHVTRLQQRLAAMRALGFGDERCRWLDAGESRAIIGCSPNLGALYFADCAAIHPAKLVRGLARVVEQLGVPIYEHTPVTKLEPGGVTTPQGRVRAEIVVRATEAFSPALPGYERSIAPLYSLMIATEPLDDAFWSAAGLSHRPTFADARHMVIYGQRTADNRIAFGGRARYHFGSRVSPAFDANARIKERLRSILRELFPMLGDAKITHQWGGAVGVPRDWSPSVGFDRTTGIAWAGGYVGDGVSTTNLAGRTIADLVLNRDTDLVHLPWVGHQSPRWEAEPLRWLGISAGRWLIDSIDRAEVRGQNPKRRLRAFARLFG